MEVSLSEPPSVISHRYVTLFLARLYDGTDSLSFRHKCHRNRVNELEIERETRSAVLAAA